MIMRFNADSGANYEYAIVYNNTGTPAAVATNGTNGTSAVISISHSGSLVIEIPNYQGSALSSTSFSVVSSGAAGNFNSNAGGTWSNTGVTSIVIEDGSGTGTMSANSVFELYGY